MSSRPHQVTKQGRLCLKNIQTRNESFHEVLRLRSTSTRDRKKEGTILPKGRRGQIYRRGSPGI